MFYFKTYRSGLLFAAFCCVTVFVSAQVKISVIPAKTVVQQNETFQLEFVINGTSEIEQFTAPAFRNFELISGPNQTTGRTWVNAALAEYVSYTVILKPKIKGKLPIASAIIKVKGKVYTSTPLVIQVTDATAFNATEEEKPDYYLLPGEKIKDKIARNIFLKATVDKQTCFAGEPILATFKLYTRLESESKVIKRPSLNGFSVIDLEEPEAGNFSKEMLNGRLYNCYLIRKVQLFPLQAGILQIEPVEVENVVRFIKMVKRNNKETSTWLDAMMEKMNEAETGSELIEERFILKTDTLNVNVQELPEKDKPEIFSGAVGNFMMEASLLQKEVAVNEYAMLRIVIKGWGNIPMLTAPVINWPATVDFFEAKMNEVIDKTTSPVSGCKTYLFPFTVSDTGIIQIPAISFSFFNHLQSAYKTVTTEPIQLKINKAIKSKIPTYFNQQPEEAGTGVTGWVWFAGVAGLLLLVVGILFFVRMKKQENKKTELIIEKKSLDIFTAKKTIAQYLHPVVAVQGGVHEKQFYALLVNAMQQYFTHRVQPEANNAGHTYIIEVLKQKHSADLATAYEQIISECEMIIFSGAEINDSKDQLLRKAIELMTEADRRF